NPVDLGHGEADRLPRRGAADAAEEGETEEGHAQMGGTVHSVSHLSGMLTPTEVGTVVGKPWSRLPRGWVRRAPPPRRIRSCACVDPIVSQAPDTARCGSALGMMHRRRSAH